jgi:hypothetical protein
MESNRIKLNTLLAASLTVVALELVARSIVQATPTTTLAVTGAARLAAIALLLIITRRLQGGLAPVGLAPETVFHGLRRGAVWSLAFGVLVALCFGGLYFAGINPLGLFRVALPGTPSTVLAYFIVGGLLAPIAEEIFFRGIVFGYLRRWGAVVATAGSTLLFLAAHSNLQLIPLPQLVGGLLFAVAYEVEKKLVVPIVIHSAGNLALFSLSLVG